MSFPPLTPESYGDGPTFPSTETVSEILNGFRSKSLLVIGDLMADQYIYGRTVRLSKEAPVPVLHAERVDYQAGGAANVARYARLLGADVNVCGIVGFDDGADHLQRELNRQGVSTGGMFRSVHRPTILKVRHVALPYGQQLLRVDHESIDPLQIDELNSMLTFIRAFIPEVDAVILADYDKRIFRGESVPRVVLDEAAKHDIPVIVDTKTHHLKYFTGADLVIAHISDVIEYIERLSLGTATDAITVGKLVMDHLRPEALLLNCNERGLVLFQNGKEPFPVSGFSNRQFNLVGSGDVLSASIALATGCGANTQLAAQIGWLAEAVILESVGPGEISPEEIVAYLRTLRPTD